MKRIDSRDNKSYRQLAELRQPRKVRASGLVFLEGLRLCADALQSGAVPVFALLSDMAADLPACRDLLSGLPADIEQLRLPDHLFASLCDTRQPQGIALVCRSPLLEQPAGPPSATGLYLVAEEIQDPGNLGTMIRTADAFAFDGVLLTAGTVFPFNEKVMRASMGSCFHIPLLALPDIAAANAWLATAGQPVPLLAADPAGLDIIDGTDGSDCRRAGLPVPAALIIGNEARGLSAEARALCSRLIRIPMPGRAESLNAASAAAILCYELMRSRFNLKI